LDRLAAVAAGARERSVRRGTPADPKRAWLTAAELVELALGLLCEAGADTDPAARARLRDPVGDAAAVAAQGVVGVEGRPRGQQGSELDSDRLQQP
jgi:hypothetical protein